MKISSAALLAVLTLAFSSCQDDPDPIIGGWKGEPLPGCNLVHEFDIEDDFDGEGYVILFDIYGSCLRCAVEIEADPDGDEDYTLDFRGGQGCTLSARLECEIDGRQLECTDAEGTQYDFDRD